MAYNHDFSPASVGRFLPHVTLWVDARCDYRPSSMEMLNRLYVVMVGDLRRMGIHWSGTALDMARCLQLLGCVVNYLDGNPVSVQGVAVLEHRRTSDEVDGMEPIKAVSAYVGNRGGGAFITLWIPRHHLVRYNPKLDAIVVADNLETATIAMDGAEARKYSTLEPKNT